LRAGGDHFPENSELLLGQFSEHRFYCKTSRHSSSAAPAAALEAESHLLHLGDRSREKVRCPPPVPTFCWIHLTKSHTSPRDTNGPRQRRAHGSTCSFRIGVMRSHSLASCGLVEVYGTACRLYLADKCH